MANTKKYYWLKLKDDFFRDKRIKKLRKIAGGDTYTVIYLKMQLLSIKNNGVLIYEGVEDTFAEELALELDEDTENVKVTLLFLLNNGLLEETANNQFLMIETIQCIGSESASAERVRKHRESKKVKALQCNTNVIESNTEKEREKEQENKRIELEEEQENKRIDYQAIADCYNETCVSLQKVKILSEPRKKAIKARLNTYSIDDIKTAFKKAEASDFLKGKNDRNWQANFDWIMKDGNLAKILEGNYDNKGRETRTEAPTQPTRRIVGMVHDII